MLSVNKGHFPRCFHPSGIHIQASAGRERLSSNLTRKQRWAVNRAATLLAHTRQLRCPRHLEFGRMERMKVPASCRPMRQKSRRCVRGSLRTSSVLIWLACAEPAFRKAVKIPHAAEGAAGGFIPLRSFVRVTNMPMWLPDLDKPNSARNRRINFIGEVANHH